MFDPVIFHGENTDINEAEKQLLSLMKLPTTIDGCHMILNQWKKTQLATGNLLLISFALVVEKPSVKESDFGTGRVGKLHAVTQTVKRTKAKETVVKGKYHYHEFMYSLNSTIH
jgi:hypothetical protein